eukprot:TRINITY_DN24087_c0_g1_i1.p2 TRINITY_DN24087_c0_g1~~TRINITY_DN24087_c0_g1_i1.p2  ORF type:complete len:187 (-),score=67.82 TRINITY_DN24087_c0_g1_i1:219-779(-)
MAAEVARSVIIASTNPVKVNCVRQGFEQAFPGRQFSFEGVSAPSGVPDQPMSDEETFRGALNRATNVKALRPQATFWVGVEGGLSVHEDGEMHVFAWIVVLSNDRSGKARTSAFVLPAKVAELIRQGYELGVADDIVFKSQNSKQAGGSVGFLTNNVVTRTSYYEQAVILALIPFLHEDLYAVTER